jgi:hypothetical protein
MSVDNFRCTAGARPELASLPVNGPVAYIGSQVLPVTKVNAKAGTYYYSTIVTDSAAQTSRAAGAAPTSETLAESSSTFSAVERMDRILMPWEMIPLIGGLDKSEARAAHVAKRNVLNALETAQLAVLVDGAGTSITSAIVDGIIDACDQVHLYAGKTAFVCNIGQYRWLVAQTEIKNLLVRTFGGLDAVKAMSLDRTVFKMMLQTLFAVDEVLIADDKFWPYGYRTTAAIVKIPDGTDDMSFISNPEYGRTMIYWPTDAMNPYEVNSFPADNLRGNQYDAIEWDSIEQFNSGAKVLLQISTSGSTTV